MKFTCFALLGLLSFASATPLLEELTEIIRPGDTLDIPHRMYPRQKKPFNFDYRVRVRAVPGQVVDSEGTKTGGLPNSRGLYRMGFNAQENVVCYNITHFNWRGKYESPASTATHLHEAAKGAAGPPRISFPNPSGPNRQRNTVGCIKGPFKTGLADTNTGQDTGKGFEVRQIICDPSAFFIDAHSSKAVPGAFRGQLPPKQEFQCGPK